MRHVDADAAGVRWEADVPLDAIGRWTWTVRAVGRRPGLVARGGEPQGRRRPGGPRAASCSKARPCSARWPAGPPGPTATRLVRRGRHRRRPPGADARPASRAALDPEIAEICDRYPDQKVAVSPDRALEVQVDPVLARFGSWYELFPRSWGGLDGVRQRLPAIAELGFDVALPAADPPHRAHQPQGPEQRARRRPGRPGQPLGDRRRVRRPHRGPRRARHARRPAGSRDRRPRPRPRDRPRLRDPVLGRPPLAHRAPRVVLPAARRHAQVRREPAQEVPGHLQRRLRLRGLAGPVAGAARRRPLLGRGGRAGVQGRQPAHQAHRRSGSG